MLCFNQLWCHLFPCAPPAKSLQPCPAPCDPMDYSLPGPSVHRILQARILKWADRPSSRKSSQQRDQPRISYISCVGRQMLYHKCHLGRLWGGCTCIYIYTHVCAYMHIYVCVHTHTYTGFSGGSAEKNRPTMQEMQVRSLGWEDPLEEETATHCSILAWTIHGQRSLAS